MHTARSVVYALQRVVIGIGSMQIGVCVGHLRCVEDWSITFLLDAKCDWSLSRMLSAGDLVYRFHEKCARGSPRIQSTIGSANQRPIGVRRIPCRAQVDAFIVVIPSDAHLQLN